MGSWMSYDGIEDAMRWNRGCHAMGSRAMESRMSGDGIEDAMRWDRGCHAMGSRMPCNVVKEAVQVIEHDTCVRGSRACD